MESPCQIYWRMSPHYAKYVQVYRLYSWMYIFLLKQQGCHSTFIWNIKLLRQKKSDYSFGIGQKSELL